MKKAKRYDDGGITEGKNTNIDDDTRARAMASAEPGMMEKEPEENFKPAPKAKAPIVTKEELAKSGLSLREYMNQKQGLKPRGEKAPAKASDEDYSNESKRSTSKAARNILEEAKENVRRGNAARSSMSAAANRMEVGRLPKKGPGLSNFKSGGMTASRRADGIASKGKTRGKLC